MTISNRLNRTTLLGNGVSTLIPIEFPFHSVDDLVVVETVLATGTQTLKVLTTHYTVPGTQAALGHYPTGGSVVMVSAPASTVSITVYRDVAALQQVILVENEKIPVKASIEAPLDRLTMIAQRLIDRVDRTMTQPDGDSENIGNLPAKVVRASRYLGFDGDGDGFGGQADTPACTAPAGYVGNADDCDDTRADVYPEAPDATGDGLDNDCDGAVDEDFDACAESFGEAAWWVSSYDTAGFGAATFPLAIYGNALVCDVTCGAGWLAFEGVTPDGFTSCEFADNFELPYLPPDGEVRACISISDPGTSSATGTCTAHTSAGDIAIDITWTE